MNINTIKFGVYDIHNQNVLTLNEWGNKKFKIDVNRQNIGEKANLHLLEFESDIISCSV